MSSFKKLAKSLKPILSAKSKANVKAAIAKANARRAAEASPNASPVAVKGRHCARCGRAGGTALAPRIAVLKAAGVALAEPTSTYLHPGTCSELPKATKAPKTKVRTQAPIKDTSIDPLTGLAPISWTGKIRADAAASKSASTSPLAQAFASWQAGVPLNEVAKTIGLKRSKLRRAFTQLAGGRDAFKQLRSAGAGGERKMPAGFGKGRPAGVPVAQMDDSKVPVITEALHAEGWRNHSRGSLYIMVDPQGVEYIAANGNERADLIYKRTGSHVPESLRIVRLRKVATAPRAKRDALVAKEVEHGQKAHAAKRAIKRARKQSRRSSK